MQGWNFNADSQEICVLISYNSCAGIGEQGLKATLPPDHDAQRKKHLYSVNGFNALLSDYISLNRSLKDIRHPG